MNILVTGASGQLGLTFQDKVRSWGHAVYFADIQPKDGIVLTLDITDRDAVAKCLDDNHIDVMINCAGYTNVDAAESDEATAFKVNAEAVGILAQEAAARGVMLIHISTDYIFDGQSGVPYGEDAEPAPLSAYGRSKLAGELAVLASACPHIIIRTSWLFSTHGKNFVKTILNKSSEQPLLKVVCDQTGTPTYAGDLADFIMHVIDNEPFDHQGIYNYTNEGVCSWYDLAREVCEIAGSLCHVEPCRTGEYPVKASRPHFSVLDKSKAKRIFGIEIPHWKDSLHFCLSKML